MNVKAAGFVIVGMLALATTTAVAVQATSQQLVSKRTTRAMITTMKLFQGKRPSPVLVERLHKKPETVIVSRSEVSPSVHSLWSLPQSRQHMTRITNAMQLYRQLTVTSTTLDTFSPTSGPSSDDRAWEQLESVNWASESAVRTINSSKVAH